MKEIEEEETPSTVDIETYDRFNNEKIEEQINEEEETTLEQICQKFKQSNTCPYYNKGKNEKKEETTKLTSTPNTNTQKHTSTDSTKQSISTNNVKEEIVEKILENVLNILVI